MSLEEIKLKIIGDAKKEAEKILKEAELKREQIIREAELKVNEIIQKAKLEFEEIKRREIENKKIVAELEVGKQMLLAKRTLLEKVFNKLQSKLENLPKHDYIAFFERLLNKAVETKEESVILGREEMLLNGNFFQELNKRNGWNLKLLSSRGNFRRGLILTQGDIDVNLSIEAILKEIREKWEDEIVRKLFSEEVSY